MCYDEIHELAPVIERLVLFLLLNSSCETKVSFADLQHALLIIEWKLEMNMLLLTQACQVNDYHSTSLFGPFFLNV